MKLSKTTRKGGENVKSTGIIRRIDDLGRIVIPKEIRRIMLIKEGDPLEISTDNGCVILTKIDAQKGISGILHNLRAYIENDVILGSNIALLSKVGELEAEVSKAQ